MDEAKTITRTPKPRKQPKLEDLDLRTQRELKKRFEKPRTGSEKFIPPLSSFSSKKPEFEGYKIGGRVRLAKRGKGKAYGKNS